MQPSKIPLQLLEAGVTAHRLRDPYLERHRPLPAPAAA
jgi:hypothetical protein